MSGRKHGAVPADLARARQRFVAWRRSRDKGTRIPEPLWVVAVKMATLHGLARTASVLRLDYYALKKHVEESDAREQASGAFVEVAPVGPVTDVGECVVEVEDGIGARMRVSLKGYAAADLTALTCSLWKTS